MYVFQIETSTDDGVSRFGLIASYFFLLLTCFSDSDQENMLFQILTNEDFYFSTFGLTNAHKIVFC